MADSAFWNKKAMAYLAERGVAQIYPGTSRAVTDARLFELPATDWGHAVKEWFPMAVHLLAGSQIQGYAARDTSFDTGGFPTSVRHLRGDGTEVANVRVVILAVEPGKVLTDVLARNPN